MPKIFRKRRTSSSSSSSSEDESSSQAKNQQITADNTNTNIKEKIEEIKFLQKQRIRTHGVDVYSLAIGETDNTNSNIKLIENDPWKSKTGGLVDMKLLKEKRGNEIVKNMHSTFAKETNQRDEDAEMQKFIEEQLKIKKDKEKSITTNEQLSIQTIQSSNLKYKTPNDVLFDVPKYLIESASKNKSEESLSEQMLSGIPEVDLGVDERIRNIEETERAKQELNIVKTSSSTSTTNNRTTSVNFVQHKRFDESLINADKNRNQNQASSKPVKQDPVVGDAPKHELLQQNTNTKRKNVNEHDSKSNKTSKKSTKSTEPVEKASDEYCFERFKKNMRFNRGSKIKIA